MPKSCNPKYLTNTTFFDDGLGTYIANGKIETNNLSVQNDIDVYGNIYLYGGQLIIPDGYVDLCNNQIIDGIKQFNSNLQLNSGLILNNGALTLSNDNLTRVQWLSNISSDLKTILDTINLAITNLSYTTATLTTKLTSSYFWVTGGLRFDGVLLLQNGSIQINNLTCSNIQYLANLNQNVQSALTTLQTKTINQSYNSTTNTTTFSSSFLVGNYLHAQTNFRLDGAFYCGTNASVFIPNSTMQAIQYLSGTSSNINTNIQSLLTKTTNITFSSPQTIVSGTLTSSVLAFTTSINSISKATFDNVMNYCGSLTQNVETNLNALKLKTTNISYDNGSNKTTISNNVDIQSLTITSSINSFSKANFENAIQRTYTLTQDAETGINSASALAAGAASASAANTATLAVITTTTIPAMQVTIAANTADIGLLDGRVSTLESKTTQMTYSTALSKTSFGSTLEASSFQFTTLTSGFTQVGNQECIFVGQVKVRNDLLIENGFGLTSSGGINQQNNNSNNTFNSPVSMTNNLTTSGNQTNINSTTTQIGTNAISTLSVNSTSTFNSDVTISNTKNLKVKNIIPHVFDDVIFGGEGGLFTTDDVVFNMKLKANEPVSILSSYQQGTSALRYTSQTYNTTNNINCSTSLTIDSPYVYCNAYFNCTNANSGTTYQINSPSISIGTNESVLSLNTITIGSVSAGSIINLNGVVNSVFPINTTSIFSQF